MDRYTDAQNSGNADSLFPYLGESFDVHARSGESREGREGAESGSVSSSAPASGKDRYTIGEVVSLLQNDHPSLTVSKVRYLERRQLLILERTSGGYRLFSDEDVQLLRRILTLQENEYLPLEVIKERIDRGIIQTGGGSDPESTAASGTVEEGRSYTKNEIIGELGADPRFIDELIEVGVIGRGNGNGPGMSRRDLEVARIATEMSKYSIQPRHLRGIVAAVDREVAMFKQVLNPDLRSGDEQRIGEAMNKARHLASVDSRLKELIMADAIDSLDRSGPS